MAVAAARADAPPVLLGPPTLRVTLPAHNEYLEVLGGGGSRLPWPLSRALAPTLEGALAAGCGQ